MAKKIYLSPSMQNHNMYAYGGTNEMEQCNKIAEHCGNYLRKHGFDVKIAPKGQAMQKSILESNSWNPDLHIPIHTNALNGSANGTLVMIYSNDKKNLQPAQCIYKHVFDVTPGTTKRAIQARTDLAELRDTKSTAVYVECEFHDNLAIAKWIIENTQVIGEAIAKGVCEYYGVNTSNVSNNDNLYRVQVGAYKNKSNAEKMINKLKDLGIVDAYINK
jgi:N-acetylmuramoyl-L-alanine amidase